MTARSSHAPRLPAGDRSPATPPGTGTFAIRTQSSTRITATIAVSHRARRARPKCSATRTRITAPTKLQAMRARTPGIRHVARRKNGIAGHEQAKGPNHRAAAQHARPRAARCLAERDRDPDDEEKEWKDQIGRGPAVPLGVQQRRVDGVPVAGLLTTTMAATVSPRNTSTDRKRTGAFYRYDRPNACSRRPRAAAEEPAAVGDRSLQPALPVPACPKRTTSGCRAKTSSSSRKSIGWSTSSSRLASTRCGSPAASRCCAAICRRWSRRLAAQAGDSRPGPHHQCRAARANVQDLKTAGLHRLTISLDTLKRDRFVSLARFDELPRVLAGIDAAVDVFPGFKIDTVIIRGVNDDELIPLLEFARARARRSAVHRIHGCRRRHHVVAAQVMSRDDMLAALERALRTDRADRGKLVRAGRSLPTAGRHGVRDHRLDDRAVLPVVRSQPADGRRGLVPVPLCRARRGFARAAARRRERRRPAGSDYQRLARANRSRRRDATRRCASAHR